MQNHLVLTYSQARRLCPRLTGSITFVIGLSLVAAVLTAPFLAYQTLRMSTTAIFDYNEGWNVVHAALLVKQGILYRPFDDLPIIPVDYPPLSFPIVIAVSYFTGSLLLAGRVVALFSFAAVGVLLFQIIRMVTRSNPAGVIASLFWLCLVSRNFGIYVGMNDPQMLGHFFTVGALYLFCRWQSEFNLSRIVTVATLCVLGIFTKHSLLAIPLALGIALLFSTPRDFLRFALIGAALSSLLLLAGVAWNGAPVITNLVELIPPTSTELLLTQYRQLFIGSGLWVLGLPLVAIWLVPRAPRFFLIYPLTSFAFGTLAMRGVGSAAHHLFDFFISLALLLGLCAASFTQTAEFATDGEDHTRSWRRLLRAASISALAAALTANEFTLARFISSDGILEPSTLSTVRMWQTLMLITGVGLALFFDALVASMKRFAVRSVATSTVLAIALGGSFFPVARRYTEDFAGLDYQSLRWAEQRYLADVRRLRSTRGPALVEEALIGFDAGKDFLFDSFLGATLMSTGRLSEDVLIRPIKQQTFGAIVLTFELPATSDKWPPESSLPTRTVSERWTDNVLRAMSEHYERDFRDGPGFYFFYRPRKLE